MNERFLLISWMCVPLVYAAGKNTVTSFTGKAKSLQKNIFKLKSQIQSHTFCWSTKVLFFFLTHRAAPNTQSFHQIRKKNWTTFQLWFAKMDTKSVRCPLKKGIILWDLVSSKSLRVSDWLLHAVLFKSITKKCMTCSSAPTVLSIGKLAGAWCVYSWNL